MKQTPLSCLFITWRAYNDNLYSDATSMLADINEVGKDNDRQKKKKKGFKGLFGKGEKIKYEMQHWYF